MDLLAITSKILTFIILLSFLSLQAQSVTVPRYVRHFCNTDTYDSHKTNILSINALLTYLTLQSSNSSFYSSSSGIGPYKEYGFFYCTANVNSKDCHTCVKTAAMTLQSYCLGSYNAAVVFYRECTLRYANWTVSATDDESVGAWSYSLLTVRSNAKNQLNTTLYSTLTAVIAEAAFGNNTKGFASGESNLVGMSDKLYAFAQCTPDILGSGCQKCLSFALSRIGFCCDDSLFGPERKYLMTFYPSCQLSHEVRKPSFSANIASVSKSPPSGLAGKNVWYVMVALVVAAVALQ